MKLHLPNSAVSQDENVPYDDSERLLAMERRQQEQKLKQRELEFEAGLMEERAQQIQAIENDIIDVNQIMRDLSAMVQQQSEVVGKYPYALNLLTTANLPLYAHYILVFLCLISQVLLKTQLKMCMEMLRQVDKSCRKQQDIK